MAGTEAHSAYIMAPAYPFIPTCTPTRIMLLVSVIQSGSHLAFNSKRLYVLSL